LDRARQMKMFTVQVQGLRRESAFTAALVKQLGDLQQSTWEERPTFTNDLHSPTSLAAAAAVVSRMPDLFSFRTHSKSRQ
jgi:hypothetical protein